MRPRLMGRQRRDRRRLVAGVPSLLEAMAREVRSGAAVAAALWSSGALVGGLVAVEVERLQREVAAGASLERALRDWADRWNDAELGVVVAALLMALEVGGEVAACCEHCAALMRDRAEVADEVGSLTAQSRASAVMLTVLPAFAAVVMALIDPATGRFLLGTTAGWCCLGGAVAADFVGWKWMGALRRGVR